MKLLESFGVFPWKSKCDLKNPERKFYLVELWNTNEEKNRTLKGYYFGREIVNSYSGIF